MLNSPSVQMLINGYALSVAKLIHRLLMIHYLLRIVFLIKNMMRILGCLQANHYPSIQPEVRLYHRPQHGRGGRAMH
jgi:hypothetical protein